MKKMSPIGKGKEKKERKRKIGERQKERKRKIGEREKEKERKKKGEKK